ncbi:hypothetical protein VNI00_011861 [Paramarasmius palmivorus]|uniref:DUF1793-domain-containing protein n=1 Tax=Paramarasmius palmivorus TaxID=297713 RepID=A0AAW0C9K4_9AGAR
MAQSPSLTWQSSTDNDARNQFLKTGRLSNSQDSQLRRINDRFVVFALSTDLGSIVNSTSPTVWSLGVVRDPAVQYRSPSGLQNRSPFYRTQYDIIGDAIDAFVKNYTTAVEEANKLDSRIMTDGDAISTEYGDLLALSTRQAMAGLEITVSSLSENQWNTSDVKAFMKDTGISQRINPVDTLFAAFPFYLYMDAKLGGLLLDPFNGPFFAGPDLGILYPQALGNNQNNEKMAIENSGNMLIMAFAHAQFSGDGTLIARHYDLLKNWTDYLVEHSLHTTNQVSSDRIAKDNSSNLAIKGILGIAAMSKISEALNKSEESDMYSANASQLASQWVDLATEGGHIVSIYGDPSSEGLIYNLYADILLKTKLVPDSVYTGLTTFYDNLIVNQAPQNIRFGLSYDGNAAGEAKAPWTLFTAATTTSNTTRDQLIARAHSRAALNQTAGDNPTTYKTDTGQSFLNYGQASPAQGAMFALLATRLETRPVEPLAPNQAPTDNSGPNRASNAGVIAGVVISGFVGVAFLAMFLFLIWRRRIQRITQEQLKPVPFDPNLLYRQRTTPPIPGNNLAGEERLHPLPVPVPPVDTSRRYRPSTSEPYTSPVSHDPSSPTNTSLPDQSQNFSMYSGSQFTSDTSHLRHEIANLRQQMVGLQAQQASWNPTPPPRYDNPRDSLMR